MIGRPSSTEFENSAAKAMATNSPGRRLKISRAPRMPRVKAITAPV